MRVRGRRIARVEAVGRRRKLARDEGGMVLLFWAFAFVGILAFFVIVADAGLQFMERRHLQNVADGSALAGARELFLAGESAALAETTAFAAESDGNLTDNQAAVSVATMEVRSTVWDDAASVFSGGLGFGNPSVQASATARVAASVSPGVGVFCIGLGVDLLNTEIATHSGQLGNSLVWDLPYDDGSTFSIVGGDYHTTLRYGARDSSSNAGYVDIGNQNGANRAVRDCFENGAPVGLSPREPTQPGIATGPAADGLQARFEKAMARGCFTWSDVAASLRAADADGNGVLENEWYCSPNLTQDTSVALLPITETDFRQDPGATLVDIHLDPTAKQYRLAYFWLDANRIFEDISRGNWQFATQGQGQAQIEGVFLSPYLTELTTVEPGAGGSVACVPGVSTACFLQLVE